MATWEGKVAVVTGASSGLGRAIVQAFADAGASLVLAARGEEQLHAAAALLSELGIEVLAVQADVTNDADVERLIAATIERFGRIDVLVNNVGRSSRGEILSVTPEELTESLEVNLLSAVRCTRAAATHLLLSRGHIINIGSLGAKSASKFLGAYPTAKFALAAYTQQLRLELNPRGVHVLFVCPGPIAREDAGQRYDQESDGLPESARRPGGGVRLKGIPPEALATAIVRGCERRKPEIVWPWKARLLFAISQLSPSWGDWLVNRMTK